MTSPLVNPASGYITLSRFDSSTSRPSISTAMRRLTIVVLHALGGRLVRAQPQEPREPQPLVRGAVAVADLDHHLRTYPMRAAGILAGYGPGDERRPGHLQRLQHGEQFLLGRAADPPADPAPEQQLAVGSDRKSTRLNSSHANISYAVFCLK